MASVGVVRGVMAWNLDDGSIHRFRAAKVIMATGGIGAIFGKSTNSVVCTGSAQSALYQQGCYYANGEFIQVHPTSIPCEDKLRLMSESARGEGGRVWVPKNAGDQRDPKSIPESERWYFLEEWYPKYGNLVPRDVATRAIFKVVYEYNLGIDGKPMVYLDLTHIDRLESRGIAAEGNDALRHGLEPGPGGGTVPLPQHGDGDGRGGLRLGRVLQRRGGHALGRRSPPQYWPPPSWQRGHRSRSSRPAN